MVMIIKERVKKYGYKMVRFTKNKLAILKKDDATIVVSMIHGVKVKNKESLTLDEVTMLYQVIKELRKNEKEKREITIF